MIIETGSKVLIVHRRLFEADKSRYFLGEVDHYESGIAKVTGYSWVQDQFGGKIVRKAEPRTKILSLLSGTLIIYELPSNIDLKKIKFEQNNGTLLVTDAVKFKMDLSEIEHRRPEPPRIDKNFTR